LSCNADIPVGEHRQLLVATLADDQAQNVLARDGAVDTAVGRVHAVVPEQKELVFAASDELFLDFAAGVGRHAVGQIGLIEFCAIDVNGAIFEVNGIATDTDNALDRKAFGGWIANDDYVLAGRGTEMVHPTVKQVMIRVVKGREHAGTDHFDGLDEVGADDVVAGQTEACDDEALKKLPKQAFATFGFGSRVAGGGFCRKRLRSWHWHIRVH